jgi:CubicO group peptidase (beta-lactamase class C family)
MFRNIALLAPFLATIPSVLALPTENCPILGPIFPSSFDLSTSDIFVNATSQFPDAISLLFEAGAVNETGQAFSIDVFSTYTNTSIYSYNHVGSAVQSSKQGGEMNDETIFRVGSVSKLYTAYAILVAAGLDVFRDPVTKYIPELGGNPRDQPHTYITWEDVSVGALLSQQGGVGGVRKLTR